MKKYQYFILGLILAIGGTAMAAVFNSAQLAPSASSGKFLQTNGSINSWATISATGGTGTISTSTVPTIGQIPYWTSNGYPSLLGSAATSTITCTGSASCGAGSYVIGSALTITGTGLTSLLGVPLTAGNFLVGDSNSLSQATSSIFIKSNGNVGIGTTGPSGILDVYNASGNYVFGDGATTGQNPYLYLYGYRTGVGQKYGNLQVTSGGHFSVSAQQALQLFSGTGYDLYLGEGTTARVTVKTSTGEVITTGKLTVQGTGDTIIAGNVGIGTTGPSGNLQVNNTTSSGNVLNLTTNGTPVFQVAYSGAVTYFADQNFSTNNLILGTTQTTRLQTSGLNMASTGNIGWSATTHAYDTLDTNISRGGVNKLYVGNGTAGDFTGTLIAGNVGIGTTSPSQMLTVGNNNQFTVDSSGQVLAGIIKSNNSLFVGSSGDGVSLTYSAGEGIITGIDTNVSGYNNLQFKTSATPAMEILTSGNVGIGTTTPRGKLDVNGSVVFEGLGTSYATTTSLGGGALLAGACSSVTITTGVSGLSSTTAFFTTPQSDPGDSFWWNTIAMSATSFKTRVCASVAGTPNAVLYNIKIVN